MILVNKTWLDADSRAIQQIAFCEMLKTNSQYCIVLKKSKETNFKEEQQKFCEYYNWLNTVK